MLIGYHASIEGGLDQAIIQASKRGANCIQVFTGPPTAYKRKALATMNIPEANLLRKQVGMEQIVVHAAFLINAASHDPTRRKQAEHLLHNELIYAERMGADYVVVHPGSYMQGTPETGVQGIIEVLNEVLTEDTKSILCLETMAGLGTEIGTTFEQFKYIIERVNYPDKLGICIDTCHMHDFGFAIKSNFDAVVALIDKTVGLEKIKVIHLNDSLNVVGSRKDRHANIGSGNIGFKALWKVAHHDVFKDVPKILETPEGIYRDEIFALRQDKFWQKVFNISEE